MYFQQLWPQNSEGTKPKIFILRYGQIYMFVFTYSFDLLSLNIEKIHNYPSLQFWSTNIKISIKSDIWIKHNLKIHVSALTSFCLLTQDLSTVWLQVWRGDLSEKLNGNRPFCFLTLRYFFFFFSFWVENLCSHIYIKIQRCW